MENNPEQSEREKEEEKLEELIEATLEYLTWLNERYKELTGQDYNNSQP
jgi:hypothetical protein